ncbi:dihydroxyacetone kinase [Cryptococcus amylolentus CBS 6039]|uniref:Dihydroxyacetone kinase n=2 Tax=Cryptococcus amylolentus TaxID=104669 RepID=A0A1E3I2P8_9TREE|nr:dihydroxyacetone kinase [Cryptococcus amylolentus CBS 6039]ODN82872.1 dihydroxyacetone kinase [Cryptococcus amylolentus CBS 6039]ODO10525.1 dihydroxyacetone kinase [Cryptococcus amylolentus CBS 6273]
MTDRHIFPDHKTLVFRSLRGLVASHPHLSLIPSLKVVYRADHDPSKVSLICGGGSGHEPGTVGFVGQGLLTASVAGDVFASPSARQVTEAIKRVNSDKGTILIITNYTGDNLHFGLARLMAQSAGLTNVELVVVGDDVSVPKTRGKYVGRRCLAGITLVCKILGAASEVDLPFQDQVTLGRSVSTNTASISMALDHCHVPGRSGDWHIPEGRVEIGLGLHNETGVFNIAQPPPDVLINQLLDLLLKQDDPERSFVEFQDGDELVLLVNNMGGMSTLEMGSVVDEVLIQLETRNIIPVRILNGPFMGSMNMPGISLSLLNLSNVAAENNFVSVPKLLEFLDAPHNSVAWPATSQIYPLPEHLKNRKREDKFIDVEEEKKEENIGGPELFGNKEFIQKAMKFAGDDVLALEPKLTKWDTIVGDGDCGETCALGAKATLQALENGLGSDGELIKFFRVLTEVIDGSMGGTLGAIFSIFLAGLTTALIDAAASSTPEITPAFFGDITSKALETLFERTAARVGHRTVMDALIPFGETLAKGGDLKSAVEACRKGGESTVDLQAKLGRATYVGEVEGDMPPDPGAMAFVAVAEGILKAYQS